MRRFKKVLGIMMVSAILTTSIGVVPKEANASPKKSLSSSSIRDNTVFTAKTYKIVKVSGKGSNKVYTGRESCSSVKSYVQISQRYLTRHLGVGDFVSVQKNGRGQIIKVFVFK